MINPKTDERDDLQPLKGPLNREAGVQGTRPQDDIFKDKMDDDAQEIEDQVANDRE